MPEVVAERSEPDAVAIGAPCLTCGERLVPEAGVICATRQVHDAEGVVVPRVSGAGEREVREAELSDSPQSLYERVIDHRTLSRIDGHCTVNRISDLSWWG